MLELVDAGLRDSERQHHHSLTLLSGATEIAYPPLGRSRSRFRPIDLANSLVARRACVHLVGRKRAGKTRAGGRRERHLTEFIESATGRSAAGRCIVEPLNRSVVTAGHIGISLPHRIQGADIASTIAQVAARESASLVVVGTRGRTCSALILLGSVTEHLMQLAACPVLAVKHASQMGLLEAVLEQLRKPEPSLTAN